MYANLHPAPSLRRKFGFTLIELSIVLVIIGLLTGGILAGQELVKSAKVKAEISQIEKYNLAVNAFQAKYEALPGDLPGRLASNFGFVARSGGAGRGDGNGLIEGYNYNNNVYNPGVQSGEPFFVWEDLTTANLIEGSFNTASDNPVGTISNPALYLPASKIASDVYIFIYSYQGNNYYGMESFFDRYSGGFYIGSYGDAFGDPNTPGISAVQAFQIDSKIDDGIPITGSVKAQYYWFLPAPAPNAASPSSSTCYDTTSNTYSVGQNKGSGKNCGLTVQAAF